KPEAPDPEDTGAESLTKEDTEEHSTDTNDTIHGRFRSASCRLCQTKLRRNDRVVLRFCCPCFNMLQDFARDYKSTEDLVCLRDTPCLDQWPARPFDPDAPHTTRSAFRHLEEQYGYVTPEWCIPCKVVHSIRLGLKFTIFRSVPAHATRALSLVNLNVLDNPELQHRGRMRHARACLSLLAQDYTRLCSDSRYTKSSTYLDEPDNKSQDTNLSLCQLLDALWVRPLHLVARSQLRENIPPDEIAEIDTAEKCVDVIVPPPDNDTSKTPVGELDSSSVSLSSHSSNVRETERRASRVTDVVDTDPSAVTAAGETIPLGLIQKGKQNEARRHTRQIQTTEPLVGTEVSTSSCLTDEKLSIDDPQPGTEAEIAITKPLHDNQNSQVNQHISQDMLADEQSESVPNSYSAPGPNSQRDAHFSGHVDRKNALSPTTTLVTYPTTVLNYDIENNRPACYCCQSSTASFVHCYRVDNDPSHHMLICSGCLWAWMAQVDAAYHDPGVQRIARRLASAAAATDSCVPLLSSASRRTLVDTARLARFFSYHSCSASCTESLSGQGKVPPKPLWFVCPGCVARRLHRLCAARFPLNCPRWYRRCLQLMCRSKSLEDLDPRLLCSTPSTEANISQTRLALVDVEYTDAVIERWLLPPEPPMVAECTGLTRSGETESSAESDSEADENATLSEASTGVSSSLSPLRLDEHETEYGAKNWWEQYSESAEEPTKLEEESELAIQGCVHAEKDMLSEPVVIGVHVPEEMNAHESEGTGTHEPDETSAHEPEETGAHEPEGTGIHEPEGTSAHESAETNAHGLDETKFHVPKGTSAHVPEETSVDFVASKRQRKVNPKFAEAVAILRPRTRVTTHASDRIVTEEPVQSENEVASEAETKESALPVKIDGEITTDQETQGSESNEPTVDEGSGVAPKETTIDTTSPSASPLPEAGAQQPVRNPRGKRKASPTIEPPIRSKRSLKINARFFDGFTGHFPSFVGEGRQIRDSSPVEDADDSETNEDGEPQSPRRLHDRRGPKQTRLSGSSRGRLEPRGGRQSSSHLEDSKTSPSQKSNGWGPRVKQVSRHALRSARLAAVGAKIPGGTSPNHAALAATARTVVTTVSGSSGTGGDGAISELPCEDNSDGHGSYDESEVDAGGSSRWSSNRTPASDSARRLPLRCGQCAACIGLIQACGRCTNCRLLQQQSSSNNTASENFKIGPCRQLICFRRRAENVTNKSGPRVKLPTNFASPNSSASPLSGSALATGASVNSNKSGNVGHTRQHCPSHRQGSPPPGSTDTPGVSPTAGAVSLLDTVPGLSQQLDADSWITQADRDDGQSSLRGRGVFQSAARYDSLNAHSHRPLTPVSGGDLGMRFNSSNQREDSDSDKDRIRPCEGEAITSELAHQGGYAIVTTMASAPPKEICYACGSGGGQLLFCVSCAEPYHFYCVERQFRPRRKDHFICRNCTQCGQCRKPAADLRCLRCSAGYHPSCLPDYPPAHSGQRGNWICPNCAVCVHCGTKPSKPVEPGDPFRAPSFSTNSVTGTTATTTTISPSERTSVSARRLIMVPWSSDVNKCAACSLAVTRGDVCPECDRAYLPTAKQMIQCDSCQLWMHRTCTKLTGEFRIIYCSLITLSSFLFGVDEYEWVARLPPGRLSKFLVNCSVCQNEKRHHENVLPGAFATDVDEHCRSLRPSDPLSVDVLDEDLETNGASRLRIIARDTLMERMADLVTNCRQSAGTSGSPLPSPSNLPSTNATTTGYAGTTGDRSNFAPTSSSSQDNVTRFNQDSMAYHRQSSQDSDYVTEKRIPQLDGTGNVDSDEDDRSSQKRTPSSLSKVYKPRGRSSGTIDPPISRASDVLLDEHDSSCSDVMSNSLFPSGRLVQIGSNLGTHSSPGSGSWNAPHANRVVYDPTSSRPTTRMRHSNPYHHRTDTSVPDRMGLRFSRAIEDDRSSMVGLYAAPPTNAKWLVEDEFEQIWTSPRAMIYRLLTRILHKLSAHPTSSPYATTLRRLLRWLSQITESFFPWLNLSEMASDVRDVLRQTNGEFNPVLRHFERLALIELHELVCPVVARLSECQLHVRLPVSGLRATNCVLSVQTLHSTIMQHLRSNHSLTLSHSSTLASNILPEWRALAEARLFITRIPPSQCHRPHELEVMDRMRNEAREERWVEHWSSIEEEMVLQYFQRHLARLSIRLRREALGQAGRNSNTHRSATAIPPRSEDQARIELPSNSGVESEMNHLEATGKQIDRAVSSETVAAVASALDEAFQDVDSVLAAEQEEMSDKHLLIPPQANNFEPQTARQQSEITNDLVRPLCSTSQLSSPAPVQMEPFYFARANVWTAAMGHRIDSSLNTANKKFGSSDGMEISNHRDPTADFDLELDSGDEDVRCCLLCGHHGDSNIEGRLLFTGADTWVHVNCALWSNEVYEEETGQLIGLSDALRRARTSVCGDCGRFGATMVCSNAHDPRCPLHSPGTTPCGSDTQYISSGINLDPDKAHAIHFACALRRRPPAPRSVFTADRSWFCSPECHRATGRQRLSDGIREMRRTHRPHGRQVASISRGKSTRFELPADADDLDMDGDSGVNVADPFDETSTDPFLDRQELLELENNVADDLEVRFQLNCGTNLSVFQSIFGVTF
ncbi:Histone-lysine N-methyltransferase MLL4, partial [Fasciola gigantica]